MGSPFGRAEKESKMAKAEVEKEQDKAKKARMNLLRTWSQRELSSDPTCDSSDSEIEEMYTSGNDPV